MPQFCFWTRFSSVHYCKLAKHLRWFFLLYCQNLYHRKGFPAITLLKKHLYESFFWMSDSFDWAPDSFEVMSYRFNWMSDRIRLLPDSFKSMSDSFDWTPDSFKWMSHRIGLLPGSFKWVSYSFDWTSDSFNWLSDRNYKTYLFWTKQCFLFKLRVLLKILVKIKNLQMLKSEELEYLGKRISAQWI